MRALSRRTMLGAGAVAAVGAGAVAVGETERGRRWLHAAGVLRGPDLAPPNVNVPVVRHVLDSRHMQRQVEWAIALPSTSPEALLVCLHGRNESHEFAFETIGVHRFVRAADLPWAVAGVDGGPDSYWHKRADGTDAEAMVFDELVPAVRALIGDLPLLLIGWSMGGYGVLLATSDHPDAVAATAAASPAVWRSANAASPGAFDSADDFHAHDLFRRVNVLRRTAIRIDCGRDDPFAANAKMLVQDIAADHDFSAGFHDAHYWRSRVPAQLAYLNRSLHT